MSVIEKILKLMDEKQITARKLTTELGLANSSVSEWKKGKAKPSLEAVVKIARYFGVTTDFLLLEETACQEAPASGPDLPPPEQTWPETWEPDRDPLEGDPLDQMPSDQRMRNYRSHVSPSPGVRFPAELSKDEKILLECYQRLDDEDKEYIRCKMVVMKRESVD